MTRWPPRPTLSRAFYKGHGLGNDYLVFVEGPGWLATSDNVRRVCNPHVGIGSDGVVAVLDGPDAGEEPGHRRVALRMFNPDGGEFERSGNGLRVLASFLAAEDRALRVVDAAVGGGHVRMEVHRRSGSVFDISVEMGRAHVGPGAVGLAPEALASPGSGSGSPASTESGPSRAGPPWHMTGPDGMALVVVPVSVGNPHMVVLVDSDGAERFTESRLETIGPFLAEHPALAEGANVQLARASGPGRAEAFIWERGVGRTSASGTSSCAVAVALVATGRLEPGGVTVEMPGGMLEVTVTVEFDVVLRGPVEELFDGCLREALVATFERGP